MSGHYPLMEPLLSTRWDSQRKTMTYKVQPAGTSKFVLLNVHELALLQEQIRRALEGANAPASSA